MSVPETDPTDPKSGQSAGTVVPQTRARSGRQKRADDMQSAVPAWPRLLNEAKSASYLSMSVWSFRELWQAHQIDPVKVPRVDSAKMRRREHVKDTLRKLLFDRLDLDALVEKWKVQG